MRSLVRSSMNGCHTSLSKSIVHWYRTLWYECSVALQALLNHKYALAWDILFIGLEKVRNAFFGFVLVNVSAGLQLLSIRHVLLTIVLLSCSHHRYMTSFMLGAVNFINFFQRA